MLAWRAGVRGVCVQVLRDGPREVEHRHFLDGTQYTQNSIARYERMFGDGFISTGGLETTKVRRAGGCS